MTQMNAMRGRRQRGAVLILAAVLLLVFLGIAAFAIDIGHLVVVKNELQNAADAGALAGASQLYFRSTGSPMPDNPADVGRVNPGANEAARVAAIRNSSVKIPVEVRLSGVTDNGIGSDVQRGHWNFSDRRFTPLDSLEPVDVANVPREELDLMDGQGGRPAFINAVRVVANRRDSPAPAFFSRIFDMVGFGMSEEAIAYIEFAGSLLAADVDQPVAICRQSITDATGNVTCNIGRMINSGNNLATSNTGGWTDFEQDNETCLAANANAMRDLVCAGGNPVSLILGRPLTATGGAQQTTFDRMRDCWLDNTNNGTRPWSITLPVVECVGNNIGNCPDLVGAVTVNMVWMTPGGEGRVRLPDRMDSPDPENPGRAWSYTAAQCADFINQVGKDTADALNALKILPGYEGFGDETRWSGKRRYSQDMARWDCFVKHFQLRNADDGFAPLDDRSMYFQPECNFVEPRGVTGGPNFGQLARIPVLVQ